MRPSDREMASYSAKYERRETPNILGEKRKTRPQNIPRGNFSDLHPTCPLPSPICSQQQQYCDAEPPSRHGAGEFLPAASCDDTRTQLTPATSAHPPLDRRRASPLAAMARPHRFPFFLLVFGLIVKRPITLRSPSPKGHGLPARRGPLGCPRPKTCTRRQYRRRRRTSPIAPRWGHIHRDRRGRGTAEMAWGTGQDAWPEALGDRGGSKGWAGSEGEDTVRDGAGEFRLASALPATDRKDEADYFRRSRVCSLNEGRHYCGSHSRCQRAALRSGGRSWSISRL